MMRKKAFTLIEMLAVIAIIALLAGILIPAVQKAKLKAQQTKARSELQQIVGAWKQYYDDYRSFEGPREGTHDMSGDYLDCLRGQDVLGNTRKFVYMEFHSSEDTFYDPWNERPYKFALYEDAGEMNADGVDLRKNVAAWSWGPDRRANTNDNIRSWSN